MQNSAVTVYLRGKNINCIAVKKNISVVQLQNEDRITLHTFSIHRAEVTGDSG